MEIGDVIEYAKEKHRKMKMNILQKKNVLNLDGYPKLYYDNINIDHHNYLSSIFPTVLCDIIIEYNFIKVGNEHVTNIFKINEDSIFSDCKSLFFIGCSSNKNVLHFIDGERKSIINYDIGMHNVYFTKLSYNIFTAAYYISNDRLYVLSNMKSLFSAELKQNILITEGDYNYMFVDAIQPPSISNFVIKDYYMYIILMCQGNITKLKVTSMKTNEIVLNSPSKDYLLHENYLVNLNDVNISIDIYKHFKLIKTINYNKKRSVLTMRFQNNYLLVTFVQKCTGASYSSEISSASDIISIALYSEVIYNLESDEYYINKQFYKECKSGAKDYIYSNLVYLHYNITDNIYLELMTDNYVNLITCDKINHKKLLPMTKEQNDYLGFL